MKNLMNLKGRKTQSGFTYNIYEFLLILIESNSLIFFNIHLLLIEIKFDFSNFQNNAFKKCYSQN